MKTGYRGTFVLSWSQIALDGVSGAPPSALSVGASWRWHGDAVRVDGPGDVLVLAQTEDAADLHRHAARVAARLVTQAGASPPAPRDDDPDEPLLDDGFSVTDGQRRHTATLIERGGAAPLCMFVDALPAPDRDYWVSHVVSGMRRPHRTGDRAAPVICFTPDTCIATPDGPRRVADLAEEELVLTKDDGPQPVRWIGWRRMSGARLLAMPDLRPVRIRAGALGGGVPDRDLTVSPQHRLLVQGPAAQALFGTDEVLVAARDLVNDRSVLVDRSRREVTYVHLLLDRHSIVFANGLETESLHPATMDMRAVDQVQMLRLSQRMPGILRNPGLYGGFARRTLTASEAAVLQHAAGPAH